MADAQSTAMRLLIHYAGDIHQPLHATTRVDKEYPKGDFGGNTVPIPDRDNITELHAVWDSVLYTQEGYADLPFSDTDWESQGKVARHLLEKIKVADKDANNLNSHDWANESFDYAKTFVYAGMKENEVLSKDYIKLGLDIAEYQIVVAGHRLANLLISLNLGQLDVYPTISKDLGFL